MPRFTTYMGRIPSRSIGIHPPAGTVGELTPYPKLEVMLSLRVRLVAKLKTLAPGSYMHREYSERIERLDAEIAQRREALKK